MKGKPNLYILVISALLLSGFSRSGVRANPGTLFVTEGGMTSGACDSWEAACDLQ